MRRALIVFILIIILASIASAITLDQALKIAKENNPKLKQAKARFDSAKAKTFQKSWLEQPSLVYNFRQIPLGSKNPANAAWYQYGFSQKIPLPHKYWLERSSYWNNENKFKYLYDQTYWDIRSQVVSAYYQLYFAKKKSEINQENLLVLKKLERFSEAKYVVGKTSQSDLLSAQIEYELIKNNDITFSQEIKLGQVRLQKLLNNDQNFDTETNPEEFNTKVDLIKIKKMIKSSNPMLQALKSEQRSFEDMHLASKTDLIGDVKTSFFQRETPGVGLTGWDFLLSAEIPLWFWSKASEVGEIGYKQDIAEQAYRDFENELDEKLEATYIKLDSVIRTEKLYKNSILMKAKQALSAAEIAYKANKIDFQSLLKAQKIYFDSKLSYERNLVDIEIYKARLEALIGGEIK